MRWVIVALMLGVSACVPVSTVAPSVWFDEWAADFSSGDHVAMARFYDPLVEVRWATPDYESTQIAGFVNATTDGQGRAWLARWLTNATRKADRSLGAVTVDGDTVLVPVTTPEQEAAALFVMEIAEGLIVEQTTLRWRDAHKPGGWPDSRLGWVDDLVASAIGADVVAEIHSGERHGPAVFVEGGRHPTTVAVLLEQTGDCTTPDALVLTLDGRQVTGERRFRSPDRCPGVLGSELRALTVPGHVQEVETVVVDLEGSVALHNSTPELEVLLRQALARFDAIGLERPRFERVVFAPADACERRSGLTTPTEESFELVVCTDAVAACAPTVEDCSAFSRSAERILLHELAHAWIEDRDSDELQDLVLAAAGLDHWSGGGEPWHRRGTEFAAETLAWGLMVDRVDPVSLGPPTCEDLGTVFEILTGLPAPHDCEQVIR